MAVPAAVEAAGLRSEKSTREIRREDSGRKCHDPKTKQPAHGPAVLFLEFGRGDRIRTYDPHVPNVVLYQAELHPE